MCVCVCQPHLEYFFGVFGQLVQDDELVSAEKTSFTEALLILRYGVCFEGREEVEGYVEAYILFDQSKGTLTKINLWKNYSSITFS